MPRPEVIGWYNPQFQPQTIAKQGGNFAIFIVFGMARPQPTSIRADTH